MNFRRNFADASLVRSLSENATDEWQQLIKWATERNEALTDGRRAQCSATGRSDANAGTPPGGVRGRAFNTSRDAKEFEYASSPPRPNAKFKVQEQMALYTPIMVGAKHYAGAPGRRAA